MRPESDDLERDDTETIGNCVESQLMRAEFSATAIRQMEEEIRLGHTRLEDLARRSRDADSYVQLPTERAERNACCKALGKRAQFQNNKDSNLLVFNERRLGPHPLQQGSRSGLPMRVQMQ